MLNGIDISSWQGTLDLSKVKTDFVIVKATGGTGYVNPTCDKHVQQAMKLGIPFGFYHYAREVGFKGSAIQEAEFFVKNTKNYFGKGIPCLDFEGDNTNDPQWALDFLNHVYKLTKVKPLFYTYTNVLNNADFSKIYKADYGLWVANYGQNNIINGFQKPNPPKSNGFSSTVIYQYSSKTVLTGFHNYLDANVFYGDKSTWKKYVESGKIVENVPSKEESKPINKKEGKLKMKKIVIQSDMNLRTKANTRSSVISLLKKGSSVYFDDITIANGYTWAIQKRNDGSKGYLAISKNSEVFGTVSNK